MVPQGTNGRYWLLCIAAGLSVGIFGLVVVNLVPDSDWSVYILFYALPALFGAIFALSLRATRGIRWWAGAAFVLGIVAAHFAALRLAVAVAWNPWSGSHLLPAFIYGATVAAIIAGLAALLFPPARAIGLIAGTVLAAGTVAIGFVPLMDWLGIDNAVSITFGLVDGTIAALLGWRLFASPAADAGLAL